MKPVKLGIPSAIDALKRLSKDAKNLENVYGEMPIEDRLYLLEIFHQESRETGSSSEPLEFSPELVSFLSKCFKRKSDLVLKTVNTYLNGTEPMEIMILLDILGALTSRTSKDKNFVDNIQDDKSLLINCICKYFICRRDQKCFSINYVNESLRIFRSLEVIAHGRQAIGQLFHPCAKTQRTSPGWTQ